MASHSSLPSLPTRLASVLIKTKDANFGEIIKAFVVLIITALAIAETLALTPEIVRGTQALGQVFRILKRKTAIHPNPRMSKIVSNVQGDMEFRNVSFKYPTRMDVTIFEDLNLKVSAGKSLAVVGQNGSGKSTVITLVMRFYDPQSGVILIDGCDIKRVNLISLRLKIGLVQQEPALSVTTIYKNIKYGNASASEIEVMEGAKASNVHEFISQMPYVGEKGVQLSGGQKQRVAIARAILKNPSILLLDEAMCALDVSSESIVQDALDRVMKGRTAILVAHMLSTIRDVDNIAVLQQGTVVEVGSHNQLVAKPDGIYKKLINLEQKASIPETDVYSTYKEVSID
ncbi:hypothetical protein MLD38_022191 [Melastoma candidum]|uniref:Uncharacterized protein n=1 Tax=Melastoma candidum TaxID=119954 RepID=A0ACB9QIJ0_9MYRT|nr:hypothetical protein MLD38_022191 [Melastoma candidum]